MDTKHPESVDPINHPIDAQVTTSDDGYYYTSGCCNKKRHFVTNFITLFALSLHLGIISGFNAAMIIILLDEGMNVRFRIVLNMLALPMLALPLYGSVIDV